MRNLYFFLCAALFASAASATTFTVTVANDSGTGSLRQAITDSNNDTAAPNTIDFNIPASGVQVITLATALPKVTHSVTIDGFSQPGSAKNTLAPDEGGLNATLQIEVTYGGSCCINGFVVGTKDGVTLTVQGLALHHFGAVAILGVLQAGTSQINVYGNYIGTAADGVTAQSHVGYGVAPQSTPAQIGGQMAWQRNLFSASGEGIQLEGTAIVEGNLIGTDATGTAAIPNTMFGIVMDFETANARIGGSTVASRNVISGNAVGILVEHHYSGAGPVDWRIQGNYIGTDWTGTQRLPNGTTNSASHSGVLVGSNSSSGFIPVIGGFDAGEGNLIAYNVGPGISADGNYVEASFDEQGNVIHHNGTNRRVNIDIGSTGITANDPGDADTGTNNVQNWPQIVVANQSGNQLTVTYSVDSTTAHSAYPLRIDFYADKQGGSRGWVAEDTYTAADAQTQRTVTLTLAPGAKAIPFVATATDANGYISEFSPAWDVIFEDDFD